MLTEHLGHVGHWLYHAVNLLHVAILACDITVEHLTRVHPSLAGRCGLMVGEHGEVFARDVVILHELRQEVNHRWCGGIFQDGDALAAVAEALPCCRHRHLGRRQDFYGVVDTRSRLSAHAHTLQWRCAADVGEQLDEIGIVDHRVVEQHLLLCRGEL